MRIPLPAINTSFGSGQKGRIQPEVRFYFDLVCPYAYLASLQLPALCERLGARIDYRPILLGGVLKALGSEPSAGTAARQATTRLDLARWAEHLRVPLRFPAAHPQRTVAAMRLLCWAPRAAREELIAALYRAYWVDGRDLTDPAELGAIAASVGLSEADAIAGLHSPAASLQLRQRTEEALQSGVFGVPTFLVDSNSGPRLFFGQDRLHFVHEALRHHPHAEHPVSPRLPGPPSALTWDPGEQANPGPLPAVDPVANQAREVTFFYDFASPFAYLASTQIEQLAARCGAVVKWHPLLLGGLFRNLGTANVPLATYPEVKRRHTLDDLARWAYYYDQPFHFPSRFPMVTVTALRLALLAGERIGELSRALFAAYWVGDADLNDPAVLESALREAGLPVALLARVAEPAVKQQLLDNTAAAERAGVFGVPTFLCPQPGGPPAFFFGQDRLLFVEKALLRGTRAD
jgi:2-hydroxychromene-2-carboxylate isomerase